VCDASPGCGSGGGGAASCCGPLGDPKVLQIPAYTLGLGEHRFRIETFVEANAQLRTTTNFTVVVLSKPIVAEIAGGPGQQSMLLGLPFSLDASSSRDPNYFPGDTAVGARVVFAWTCVVRAAAPRVVVPDTSCFSVDSLYGTADASARVLQVPAIFAGGDFETVELLFSVRVSSASDPDNNASAQIGVHLNKSALNGTVVVEHQAATPFQTAKRLNVNDKMVLWADVAIATHSDGAYRTLDFEWSSSDVDVATRALTPVVGRGVGSCDADADRHCAYLVLVPDSLLAGRQYTFDLDVTEGEMSSRSSLLVTVNSPPSKGQLTVSPQTGGLTLVTLFDMVAGLWTDKELDLPLAYTFMSRARADAVAEFIVARSVQPQARFYLPVGLNFNETLEVIVVVADGLGAEARRTEPVQCRSPPTNAITDAVVKSLTVIDQLLEEGNAFNAMVYLSQSSALLNSAPSSAPVNSTEAQAGRRRRRNSAAAAAGTVEEAIRGKFLDQLVASRESIVANAQGLQLQAAATRSATSGQLNNATSMTALGFIQDVTSTAFDTKDPSVMTPSCAEALVGTVSNLFSAGVQNANTSIVTIRDTLNKTAMMQNALLVSGEVPVETRSDNVILSSSRQDLSSAGVRIGTAAAAVNGSRHLTGDAGGAAASFVLPKMDLQSSVGVVYVQFMQVIIFIRSCQFPLPSAINTSFPFYPS
jgi:hypothetical protein